MLIGVDYKLNTVKGIPSRGHGDESARREEVA
jgi:hypothetical protein